MCEIKPIGEIVDLNAVKEFFGFSDPDWINGVQFAFSPTMEVVVFAYGNSIAILSSRWNNDKQHNNFTISTKVVLENPNEHITSVLVIPISTQHSSSIDWTLIVVGLDSGIVRFLIDSGKEIHTQCFHNEPVQSIKSQSGKRINEEIHISYGSCIVIVEASHLLPPLISFRQQLKKVHNGTDHQPLPPTTIHCRKWGFNEKNMIVTDNIIVGPQKTCSFDHLLTASLDSFDAKFRNTPPQNSLIMSCGSKPYVGFNYAKEGFVQPVLKDVAKAVASKIITWFSSNQPPADPAQQMSASEPMICRFGLCDMPRNAFSIILAPRERDNGFQLACVTDNLGRVVLIDAEKGIALRMWKGYRDANCAFIKTNEKIGKNVDKKDRRSALFLIIFAPRRACLEIWPLQNGHKIATFHASKTGKLVYLPHNIMGASISTHNQKLKYSNNTCLFFDPTEQLIKEISIPFHCALSDMNSKTAKDLHLLKRLKALLKSRDSNNTTIVAGSNEVDDEDEKQFHTEISTICGNLQTDEIKLHCLEMLVKNKKTNPKIFENALKALEQTNIADVTEETTTTTDEKAKTLTMLIENYLKLVKFYNYLFDGTTSDTEDESDAVENLTLADNELVTIKKIIDLSTVDVKAVPASSSLKVKFEVQEVNANNFMDYLSVFSIGNATSIQLKTDCKPEQLATVGEIIFKGFLEERKPLGSFVKLAADTNIECEDLLKMFLSYWLKKPLLSLNSDSIIEELSYFIQILIQICVLAGEKVKYDNSSICLWWQTMREFFMVGSSCPLRSLLAAIVCRHVGVKYQEDSTDENWEQVSQEACQWSLLIGKLDEIAVLNTIISHPKTITQDDGESNLLPKIKYDHTNISLEHILQGGKGIISELVAKWIAGCGFLPENLLKMKAEQTQEPPESQQLIDEPPNADPTTESLQTLQEYFPFSLQPDIILCQLSWNYMSYWSKNLSRIDAMEAGIKCLVAIPKSSLQIKHGLCCMIWNAHLKLPLEAIKRLIDKTGRLPKEKLCMQDIGFSDSLVPLFLDACIRFLQTFSTCLGFEQLLSKLQYEDLLQDGPIPLVHLAVDQNRANSILISLHIELTSVLHAIAFFNIKFSKPIRTLFDGMACQSFIHDINHQLTPLPQADMILRRKRTDFLCIVVTQSVDLIREETEHRIYLDEHIEWMQRIDKICDMWDLDNEDLKRHQIVELYAHEWDTYAEEILQTIIDTQSMGKLLLEITGRRLKRYSKNSPELIRQIAAVGPMLTDYLENLATNDSTDDDDERENVNLDNLIKLCGLAFHSLSQKTSKELRIAGLVMNACITIKELGL